MTQTRYSPQQEQGLESLAAESFFAEIRTCHENGGWIGSNGVTSAWPSLLRVVEIAKWTGQSSTLGKARLETEEALAANLPLSAAFMLDVAVAAFGTERKRNFFNKLYWRQVLTLKKSGQVRGTSKALTTYYLLLTTHYLLLTSGQVEVMFAMMSSCTAAILADVAGRLSQPLILSYLI